MNTKYTIPKALMVPVAVLGLGLSACEPAQQEATETAPAADSPEMKTTPPTPPEVTQEDRKKAKNGGRDMMPKKMEKMKGMMPKKMGTMKKNDPGRIGTLRGMGLLEYVLDAADCSGRFLRSLD